MAGCSSVGGTPNPSQGTPSATSPNLHGAPHVANPLNVGKYLKAPCTVISESQLKSLALKYKLGTDALPGKGHSDLGNCDYQAKGLDPHAAYGSIGFLKGGAGLSAQYEQRDTFTSFKPLTVSGYPAVNDVAEGESGSCDISVGLSDAQALHVEFDGTANKSQKFMCEAAKAMATAAVETIKSGQGK
jgi:hypothetical protein